MGVSALSILYLFQLLCHLDARRDLNHNIIKYLRFLTVFEMTERVIFNLTKR
jgi:hypothetical protein